MLGFTNPWRFSSNSFSGEVGDSGALKGTSEYAFSSIDIVGASEKIGMLSAEGSKDWYLFSIVFGVTSNGENCQIPFFLYSSSAIFLSNFGDVSNLSSTFFSESNFLFLD